jgi:hypothetical protein
VRRGCAVRGAPWRGTEDRIRSHRDHLGPGTREAEGAGVRASRAGALLPRSGLTSRPRPKLGRQDRRHGRLGRSASSRAGLGRRQSHPTQRRPSHEPPEARRHDLDTYRPPRGHDL